MATIEPLTEASPPETLAAARSLFRSYAGFLRSISACHGFNFDRFEAEILSIPDVYISRNGELLLAFDGASPVACIAYGSVASAADPTCEIKRLFVLPEARGHHLSEHLILTLLDRARARGYRSAILDTEPTTMPAAYRIYRQLGFTEFHPFPDPAAISGSVYLRRSLTEPVQTHAASPSAAL